MSWYRKVVWLMIFCFCLPSVMAEDLVTLRFVEQSKHLVVNGQVRDLDMPVQMVDGVLMAPFRAVMQELGGRIEWLGDTCVVFLPYSVVQISSGSADLVVDDHLFTLEKPTIVLEGRLFVPLLSLVESLGGKVLHNNKAGTVIVAFLDSAKPEQEQKVISGKMTPRYFSRLFRKYHEQEIKRVVNAPRRDSRDLEYVTNWFLSEAQDSFGIQSKSIDWAIDDLSVEGEFGSRGYYDPEKQKIVFDYRLFVNSLFEHRDLAEYLNTLYHEMNHMYAYHREPSDSLEHLLMQNAMFVDFYDDAFSQSFGGVSFLEYFGYSAGYFYPVVLWERNILGDGYRDVIAEFRAAYATVSKGLLRMDGISPNRLLASDRVEADSMDLAAYEMERTLVVANQLKSINFNPFHENFRDHAGAAYYLLNYVITQDDKGYRKAEYRDTLMVAAARIKKATSESDIRAIVNLVYNIPYYYDMDAPQKAQLDERARQILDGKNVAFVEPSKLICLIEPEYDEINRIAKQIIGVELVVVQ